MTEPQLQLSNVEAIKMFFNPPEVSMKELKDLNITERQTLGDLCRVELNATQKIMTK